MQQSVLLRVFVNSQICTCTSSSFLSSIPKKSWDEGADWSGDGNYSSALIDTIKGVGFLRTFSFFFQHCVCNISILSPIPGRLEVD